MLEYIVRRILWAIALLIIVSGVIFAIFYLLPTADPATLRGGRQASPEQIERIRESLGLDRPVIVQYLTYMKQVFFHFDFGYSYQYDTPVTALILDRLGATASLTFGAALLWLLMGIPIGIIAAVKSRSLLDRSTMVVSLALISAPVFWLGLIALYLFADDIGLIPILPGAGSYEPLSAGPIAWAGPLILPWVVLAAASAAVYARYLRSDMIDVMGEDYIRTARAKGLPEKTVVTKHAVRSAITPIITLLGLDIGVLLAGNAILTESVFNIPGVGRLVLDAIQKSDLPLIQGVTLFGAFFIVLFNLIVDIAYAYLDPRVTYDDV